MSESVRRVAVFGATGSIGRQTLDVLSRLDGFKVVVMTAGSRGDELARLAKRWTPEWLGIHDTSRYPALSEAAAGWRAKVVAGPDAAEVIAREADFDLCVNGLVGTSGLIPSYNVLNRGIDLALANKESLILAGELLIRTARERNARILPIDSEHSAIFQCLQGERIEEVRRLILTASGGPFREWRLDLIADATPEQALNHPTWRMGRKISVDSATLMNKGLEIIEAYHLFELPLSRIEVRIHPVSVVHSLVEFVDGSFKAQLGTPDMRIPIQYALTHPERRRFETSDDPSRWPPLEFFPVEDQRYPCLGLAYRALEMGGTATAVLSGADETAVSRFLNGEIRFGEIAELIREALDSHTPQPADDIAAIIEADRWARRFVSECMPPRTPADSPEGEP